LSLVAVSVRRQINWDWLWLELTEYLAHLVVHVRRRLCGVASAGFAVFSF
jgi:hypothetical protein